MAAAGVVLDAASRSLLSAASCLLHIPSTGAQVAAQSAWAGLAAGFLHTLCGPDHLAVRVLERGAVAGARWLVAAFL